MGLDALIIVYVSKHNRDIKCALNKYEMAFRLYQIRMQKMMKICFVRIFVWGIFLQSDFYVEIVMAYAIKENHPQ